MIIVAAMGSNRVIGSGSGMPWNVPEEYRHFLGLIHGQTVIMGRRSWNIFGTDLTSEHNIVISRSASEIERATLVRSIPEAIERAGSLGRRVYSAGGSQIYAQTLAHAREMNLSIIKGDYQGDTFFPDFDESDWEEARREDHDRFEYRVYFRR